MAEKTFYALIVEHDINAEEARAKGYDPPRGPLLIERYLDNESAQSEELTLQQAERFERYGWVRVAKITVDIPGE